MVDDNGPYQATDPSTPRHDPMDPGEQRQPDTNRDDPDRARETSPIQFPSENDEDDGLEQGDRGVNEPRPEQN